MLTCIPPYTHVTCPGPRPSCNEIQSTPPFPFYPLRVPSSHAAHALARTRVINISALATAEVRLVRSGSPLHPAWSAAQRLRPNCLQRSAGRWTFFCEARCTLRKKSARQCGLWREEGGNAVGSAGDARMAHRKEGARENLRDARMGGFDLFARLSCFF